MTAVLENQRPVFESLGCAVEDAQPDFAHADEIFKTLRAWRYELAFGEHRAVHAGRKALSAEVSFDLAEHSAQDALSPLEVRVLRLIANGDTNREIGRKLSVTEEAVKSQVRNILSKLGTDDRTHAAVIGLKRGIIEL